MPKKNPSKKKNNFHFMMLVGAVTLFVFFFFNFGDLTMAARGGKGGGKPKNDPNPTPVDIPQQPGELLTNTSFESFSGKRKTPDGWVEHYEQPNKLAKTICDVSHQGNCSYYVDGKKSTAIKQFVTYSAPAGSTVTISGWGKGRDVIDNTNPSSGSFWVQTWIHYTDGSTNWSHIARFNFGTHDFEQESSSFVVPKDVEGFTYFVKFDKTGYAWFDDVSLTVALPQ